MTTVLNYPVKSDFYLSNIPKELRALLDFTYREKYAELYEENHGNILLEDICVKILNQLKDNDELLTYQRYFFMGLIMSNAIIPTIKIYLPNDDRTEKIYQFVNYLSTNQSLTSSTKFIESIESRSYALTKTLRYVRRRKYLPLVNSNGKTTIKTIDSKM